MLNRPPLPLPSILHLKPRRDHRTIIIKSHSLPIPIVLLHCLVSVAARGPSQPAQPCSRETPFYIVVVVVVAVLFLTTSRSSIFSSSPTTFIIVLSLFCPFFFSTLHVFVGSDPKEPNLMPEKIVIKFPSPAQRSSIFLTHRRRRRGRDRERERGEDGQTHEARDQRGAFYIVKVPSAQRGINIRTETVEPE